MTVVVGTNSYGDEDGLEAFATARGKTLTTDKTQLLILAMDYIESLGYISIKYSEFQPLQFPRLHTLYGDVEGKTPDNVITAQYAIAVLIDEGYDFTAPIERAIKSEKVDVLTTVYTENASDTVLYPHVSRLLRRYLKNSGWSFEVKRG